MRLVASRSATRTMSIFFSRVAPRRRGKRHVSGSRRSRSVTCARACVRARGATFEYLPSRGKTACSGRGWRRTGVDRHAHRADLKFNANTRADSALLRTTVAVAVGRWRRVRKGGEATERDRGEGPACSRREAERDCDRYTAAYAQEKAVHPAERAGRTAAPQTAPFRHHRRAVVSK